MKKDAQPARGKPAAIPAADGLLTEAEFQQWLAADPANQERFDKIIAAVVGGQYGAIPPTLLTAAQQILAKKQAQQRMRAVSAKLHALMALLAQAPETHDPVDRVQQCRALADEITDSLLDLPEPERSEFLKHFVPMRDKLRALP